MQHWEIDLDRKDRCLVDYEIRYLSGVTHLSLESDSVIGNSLGTSMVTCRGLNSPNCVAAGIGGLPVSALRKGADHEAVGSQAYIHVKEL